MQSALFISIAQAKIRLCIYAQPDLRMCWLPNALIYLQYLLGSSRPLIHGLFNLTVGPEFYYFSVLYGSLMSGSVDKIPLLDYDAFSDSSVFYVCVLIISSICIASRDTIIISSSKY